MDILIFHECLILADLIKENDHIRAGGFADDGKSE